MHIIKTFAAKKVLHFGLTVLCSFAAKVSFVRLCLSDFMAGIAQLVRALVCGTGGRGFKFRYSPHFSLLLY